MVMVDENIKVDVTHKKFRIDMCGVLNLNGVLQLTSYCLDLVHL